MFGITTPSHRLIKIPPLCDSITDEKPIITVIRNTFSHTTCQLHEVALSLLLVHWIALVLVLRFSVETTLLSFHINDLLLDPGAFKKSTRKKRKFELERKKRAGGGREIFSRPLPAHRLPLTLPTFCSPAHLLVRLIYQHGKGKKTTSTQDTQRGSFFSFPNEIRIRNSLIFNVSGFYAPAKK